MSIKSRDLRTGDSCETQCIDSFRLLTGSDLAHTTPGHRFDYISEENKVLVEIKGRHCRHDRYPTTMVGMSKINAFQQMDGEWKLWLGVCFSDGLWAAQITPEVIGRSCESRGGRCDRGRPEYRQYLYIPMSEFTKVEGSHSSLQPHQPTPQQWRRSPPSQRRT